jgi:hypothetical protein
MSLGTIPRVSRVARIAYSRHPAARLYRTWRCVVGRDGEFTGVLLLPLAGLALSLFLLSIPGASDAVAAACSIACLP